MKYSKEIVNSYINGTDIEGYSIDELENDKEFMMLVIQITNDKNFYNLCSQDVKKDYDFVKFMIDKLIVIMTSLTEKRNEKKYSFYKLLSDTIFTLKRVIIEVTKIGKGYTSNEIGMGFALIVDSFSSSKIVLDFYAKKFIEAIFEENDIDLENMLHQQFDSIEQINEIGINNYMLNFIGHYDSVLASYLSTNIELMREFSDKIREIEKNWDKYISINEQKKYNLIFDKVNEYMNETQLDGLLTETDLLYYVGKELGIVDKIAKYDKGRNEFAEDIINGLDDDFLISTLNVSFNDRMHYNNVKKIITSILFTNRLNETFDGQQEDIKHNGKKLKLKNSKNKQN